MHFKWIELLEQYSLLRSIEFSATLFDESVAYSKVPSWHMPWGTEKDCEKLKNCVSSSLTGVQKEDLLNVCHTSYPLSQFSLEHHVEIVKSSMMVHMCTCMLKYWFQCWYLHLYHMLCSYIKCICRRTYCIWNVKTNMNSPHRVSLHKKGCGWCKGIS